MMKLTTKSQIEFGQARMMHNSDLLMIELPSAPLLAILLLCVHFFYHPALYKSKNEGTERFRKSTKK